jgi:hypothetical protein
LIRRLNNRLHSWLDDHELIKLAVMFFGALPFLSLIGLVGRARNWLILSALAWVACIALSRCFYVTHGRYVGRKR